MKFGKTIKEYAVPEWFSAYLDYRIAKKKISAVVKACAAEDGDSGAALEALLTLLKEESRKVDRFLLEQSATFDDYVAALWTSLAGYAVYEEEGEPPQQQALPIESINSGTQM